MAIKIDIEPIKSLLTSPDSFLSVADNPGFRAYWKNAGRDPVKVATTYAAGSGFANAAAALESKGAGQKSVLAGLGRLSGVSIEQLLIRHLPGSPFIDTHVVFVPGGDLALVTHDNMVVINAFELELRGAKIYLRDFHLLSLLANRIHRLCSQRMNPGMTGVQAILVDLLLEGAATLFFTMPVSGPVYAQWQQAEKRRDQDITQLRGILKNGSSLRDLEGLALSGDAALACKYPIGTWMCQVIESAFGRGRLVELLQNARGFVDTYEEARVKFSLADKYSIA